MNSSSRKKNFLTHSKTVSSFYKNSFLFYKSNFILKSLKLANTDILSPFEGELIRSNVQKNSWWNHLSENFFIQKQRKKNYEIFLTKKDMFSIIFPKAETFEKILKFQSNEISVGSANQKLSTKMSLNYPRNDFLAAGSENSYHFKEGLAAFGIASYPYGVESEGEQNGTVNFYKHFIQMPKLGDLWNLTFDPIFDFHFPLWLAKGEGDENIYRYNVYQGNISRQASNLRILKTVEKASSATEPLFAHKYDTNTNDFLSSNSSYKKNTKKVEEVKKFLKIFMDKKSKKRVFLHREKVQLKILQFHFDENGKILARKINQIDPLLNSDQIPQKQKNYSSDLKKVYKRNRNFVLNLLQKQSNLSNKQNYLVEEFFTKYQKRFYKLKGLCIGKPYKFAKLRLGQFLFKGDFINCLTSFHKTGQILHLNSKKITLRHAQPFLVSAKGILHVHQGDPIFKNLPIITLPFDTFTTGDIVQGIPKVEQYLEARTTQNGRLFLYSLPILLQGIFKRYCTKFPLDQAVSQSFLKIQLIIVDGVQRVYRSQGVSISDKHLEVIVKQMTSKIRIIHGGQTGFFPGELVDLEIIERMNPFLMVKIQYEPVVLGITRASLEVESFLSAASFQQTTKILAKASLYKKKDFLKGLKENILIGNLIPAGTGYMNIF